MYFEGRRRTSHTPNLTPLIDVVFLLLIFFMLTSHFVRDEAIPLNLPTADSATPLEGVPFNWCWTARATSCCTTKSFLCRRSSSA